ncbi:MAG: DM13 domain-containing protein [Candidatus Limnocylindrales bacterium]
MAGSPRRGRHPRRTGTILALFLVVALPVGWYLGSPIFVRTSLVEAAPLAAIPATAAPPPTSTASTSTLSATAARASALPASATPRPTSSPGSTPGTASPPAPSATAGPRAPTVTAVGRFRGTDDFHFGFGTASIIEVEPGRYHLRLEDFSVRNGPDLYVYLSPKADGYTSDALELGSSRRRTDPLGTTFPPGTDPGSFRSAIIWCKQFSHLFATAPFTGS